MPEHQKQHLTPTNGAEGGGAEGAVQLYRPPNMMAGAIPPSGGISYLVNLGSSVFSQAEIIPLIVWKFEKILAVLTGAL
jgi:hypothetical protein